MGYYSSFSNVTVESGDSLTDKKISEELYNAREDLEGLQAFGENCKGYDATFDLCKFSTRYPNALFYFKRYGEENLDIMKTYVKNGRFVELLAEISFPEFDESMLMKPIS